MTQNPPKFPFHSVKKNSMKMLFAQHASICCDEDERSSGQQGTSTPTKRRSGAADRPIQQNIEPVSPTFPLQWNVKSLTVEDLTVQTETTTSTCPACGKQIPKNDLDTHLAAEIAELEEESVIVSSKGSTTIADAKGKGKQPAFTVYQDTPVEAVKPKRTTKGSNARTHGADFLVISDDELPVVDDDAIEVSDSDEGQVDSRQSETDSGYLSPLDEFVDLRKQKDKPEYQQYFTQFAPNSKSRKPKRSRAALQPKNLANSDTERRGKKTRLPDFDEENWQDQAQTLRESDKARKSRESKSSQKWSSYWNNGKRQFRINKAYFAKQNAKEDEWNTDEVETKNVVEERHAPARKKSKTKRLTRKTHNHYADLECPLDIPAAPFWEGTNSISLGF
ncbi:hypothetical protein BZG36_02627 [Bifiguratus adelaidae]|uniref:UBZ4-type domain-containing protein n=1 Tax=Bifiguratus adelaidae TaxID=1938954 RepID=A0A261Y2M4_9FUNG|nr:hypothetical protein BZG36_02627 [Bifiguratus adelaidae]